MHVDKAGNELLPGTKVLYLRRRASRTMYLGIVDGHTPKMVRMENGDLQFPALCVVYKEP